MSSQRNSRNNNTNVFHDIEQEPQAMYNAQNVQVENSFIGDNFPYIWKEHLPKVIFSADGEDPYTFTKCEVMVHWIYNVPYKSGTKDPIVTYLYQQSDLFCLRSDVLTSDYIKQSISECVAVIVVYGEPVKVGIPKTKKQPVGFATLNYPMDYVPASNDTSTTPKQSQIIIKSPLYIDVICSPFASSGLGKIMIDALEAHTLRSAFAKHNVLYDGLSLRALPSAYNYFISKCGFVRTNGRGSIWPFAEMRYMENVDKKWHSFYELKDLDPKLFPSTWSNGYVAQKMTEFHISSPKEFWKYVRPTINFKKDGEDHGYYCMKPVGKLLSGGSIHKPTSEYVMYADHKKRYRIYLDCRKKCIHVQGKYFYLSNIRGKYKYV